MRAHATGPGLERSESAGRDPLRGWRWSGGAPRGVHESAGLPHLGGRVLVAQMGLEYAEVVAQMGLEHPEAVAADDPADTSWSPRWASSTRSWSWPMTSAVALPGVDERLRRPAERGQPALPLGDAPGAPGMPRTGCAEHAGYSGVPGMPRTGCAEHAGYAGAPGMPRTGCAEHAGYAGAPGMPRTGDTGDTGSGGCAARSRSGADVEQLSSRFRAGMEPPDAVCWRRTDMGATATTGVTTGDGCARAEHGDRSHRGPASRRWLRTP